MDFARILHVLHNMCTSFASVSSHFEVLLGGFKCLLLCSILRSLHIKKTMNTKHPTSMSFNDTLMSDLAELVVSKYQRN